MGTTDFAKLQSSIYNTGVTNAANLSFMVNVAYRLRADIHARDADSSVLLPLVATTQQPVQVRRIAFLGFGSPPSAAEPRPVGIRGTVFAGRTPLFVCASTPSVGVVSLCPTRSPSHQEWWHS